MKDVSGIDYSAETKRALTEIRRMAQTIYKSGLDPVEAVVYYSQMAAAADIVALLAEKHGNYRDYHRWAKSAAWAKDRLLESLRKTQRNGSLPD